jgi:hypothetical protein
VQVCSPTLGIRRAITILYLFLDPYRRTVCGRAVNASCSTYLFPADTVESQRMSMQVTSVISRSNGHYLARMSSILGPIIEPFYRKFHEWMRQQPADESIRCLDLGCVPYFFSCWYCL